MRIAIDTNILIYAHLPSLPEHAEVRRCLEGLLGDHETKIIITANVLHEFIHVVTDARRFTPPVSMSEASAVAGLYLGRPNIECLPLDEKAVFMALELIESHRLGRRRLADTLYAAALIQNKVKHLLTCNPADFRIFDELEIIDPRN